MKVIYIAGPYRGKSQWVIEQNIWRAKQLAAEVNRTGKAIALCPHTNTAHMDGMMQDQYFLDATLELMRRCDAVMLTSDWALSEGAQGEVREAYRLKMPVFDTMTDLRVWLGIGVVDDLVLSRHEIADVATRAESWIREREAT